ncbi:hypothetical protein Trydic_g3016 [Trypoxylus dichotomus]
MVSLTKVCIARIVTYLVLLILGAVLIGLIITSSIYKPVEDTCKPIPDLPWEISITPANDNNHVVVTWSESYDNARCGVTYRVDYSVDGSNEDLWISDTSFKFLEINGLEECSFLQVRVRAINKFGDVTVHYAEQNYTVNSINQPVAAVEGFDTSEGVVVTWHKPVDLTKCDIRYSVTVKTELGIWMSEMVDVERILIPWQAYCLLMDVRISSWINRQLNYDTIYHYTSKRNVEDIELKTSFEDPKELIISWRKDTHQELCGLTYKVNYFAYDPALTQNVTTTNGEARFRFVYCMSSAVIIKTINNNGDLSGPQAYLDATQYPQNITEVQGLTINVTQENVIVVWLPVLTVETCNVTYRIEFITDLNNFTYTNVTSPLQLPKPNYCSVLGVQVGILIGQYVVHSSLVQILENIDRIHDLKLEPSTKPNTLLAKWTEHPKKELCGLAYEVIYRYRGYFTIFTTNQSSVPFDAVYCTDVFVEVAAVRGNTVSERSNATYKGYPDVLEQVYNIAMSIIQNNTLSVSWASPLSISQCNILYNVTAINMIANERSSCNGTSDCEITLSSFCPGAPFLPIRLSLSKDGEDVLIAWSGPVLVTNCNNSYMFRYSVNGGTEIEITTTDLSYRLRDVSLCSDVVLLFWTVSESGNLSDEYLERNYTVIPFNVYVTNLSAIESAEGVVATWKRPTLLEPCQTSFRVRYSSELGDFSDRTDNETILVPQEIFCFVIQVQVANVVGFTETGSDLEIFWEARNLNIEWEISPQEPDVLDISWQHPNQQLCSITYNVSIFGINYALATSKSKLSINFTYCRPMLMAITPIALNGAHSGEMIVTDITQLPQHVEPVEYTDIEHQNDSLTIHWIPLEKVWDCSASYLITFSTELGELSYETNEPLIEFSREFYCFMVDIKILVRIRGVTGEVVGKPAKTTIKHEVDPIEDLELTPLTPDNTTLTITWAAHRLQQQCDLEYIVAYEYGMVSDTFTTNQNSVSIIGGFCTTTVVRVKRVHGNEKSIEAVKTYVADYPSSLEPASNITINITTTSAVISWDVPLFVSQCADLYTVIGKTKGIDEGEACQGTSSCEIILDDFCAYTSFIIKPTSLPGVPVSFETILCS